MRPSVDGHMWVGDVLAFTTHRGLALMPRMDVAGHEWLARGLVSCRTAENLGLPAAYGSLVRVSATAAWLHGEPTATAA